ncbi:MAG TPA: DinB family protein [Fimbriimonas sp.]
MREDLRELWDSIESRKWRILETVARLPEDALTRKMPRSDWTPLQLVEHLVVAEEQQLREIEAAEKSEGGRHKAMVFRSAVWVLRKGIRVPPSATMRPSASPASLPELGTRWEKARERLRQALEEAKDLRPLSVHAQFGTMTADQVLTLTDAHLQYHQRQIGA